ncbi:MAG: hypothetical protein ABIJ27_07735 [Candidatus Omnitrophota bacterium]
MIKVKCKKCGSVGYTASPYTVKCSLCGGPHKVVKMEKEYPQTNIVKKEFCHCSSGLEVKWPTGPLCWKAENYVRGGRNENLN